MISGHCEHNISNTEFRSSFKTKLFLHPVSSFRTNSTPSAHLFRPEVWQIILDFFFSLFPTSTPSIITPSIVKVYQFNLQNISQVHPFIVFCPAGILFQVQRPHLGFSPGFPTHPSPHYQFSTKKLK